LFDEKLIVWSPVVVSSLIMSGIRAFIKMKHIESLFFWKFSWETKTEKEPLSLWVLQLNWNLAIHPPRKNPHHACSKTGLSLLDYRSSALSFT
jgi:hypothetical protein